MCVCAGSFSAKEKKRVKVSNLESLFPFFTENRKLKRVMLVKTLFIRHYVPRAKIKPQLFRGFYILDSFSGPMLKHWRKIVRGTLKMKFINTGKGVSTVSIELERGFREQNRIQFYFLEIYRNSKITQT